MDYCTNCGNAVPVGSPTCNRCGMSLTPARGFRAAYTAPNDFTAKFHSFGGSTTFLIGILLFTAGNLMGVFVAFGFFSIISLLLMALPITGFWLIYAASRSPSYPDKSLTALTLFKISVIIGLVVVSLIGVGLLIFFIWLFSTFGFALVADIFAEVPGFALLFLAIFIGIILFVIYYFKSLLTVLSDLRNGLQGRLHDKVRNVGLFTALMGIIVGFSIIYSVITIAAIGFAQQMMSIVFDDLFGFGDFGGMIGFMGFDP